MTPTLAGVNKQSTPDLINIIKARWNRLSGFQRALLGAVAMIAVAAYVLLWTAEGALAGSEDTPGILTVLDLGAKLLIVLALIYLSSRALKAISGRSVAAGNRRSITVVEVAHLANNRTLYLVDVAGRQLLLGATPTQITTLTQFDGTPPAGPRGTEFKSALIQAASATPEDRL